MKKLIDKIIVWIFPEDSPSEKAPFLYYTFFRIYSLNLFKPLHKIFKIIGEYLAFDVPEYFLSSENDKKRWRAFKIGYLIAFVLTFLVIIVMSASSGTLYGNEANRYYFFNDIPDIVNYVVIVPLYIGIGSYILTVISEGYLHLKKIAINNSLISTPSILPQGSISLIILVTFSLASFFTVQYISEVLDPNIYNKHFWFISSLAKSGERLFSSLGVYYTILTFVLLFFSFILISSFLSFFILSISIGDKLLIKKSLDEIDIDDLKIQMKYFIDVSIAAKIVASIYMLNAFTWRYQHPINSFNMNILLYALLIFGVFIVTLPRYYIEIKLFALQIKTLKNKGTDLNKAEYIDLRPPKIKKISLLIDMTVISAFTTIFFNF